MHPAPEIPARPAQPEEIPAGARKVLEAAQRWGWSTRCTYARGTDRATDGTPKERVERRAVDDPEKAGKQHEQVRTGELVVVDSVLVVITRAGDRLAGAWIDGTFAYGWSARCDRIASSTSMLECVIGVAHTRPVAPRELVDAVADAMRPRKLKAGVVTRSHAEACMHVAQRYDVEVQALGEVLRAVGAMPADV